MRPLLALVAVAAALFMGGCSYYRVTDLSTGQVYYTRNQDLIGAYSPIFNAPVGPAYIGTLSFIDAASGRTVTLGDYEIEKISQQGYQSALFRDR